MLGPENGDAGDVDGHAEEGEDDHGEEVAIVAGAHAVVDPDAVVVEPLRAPPAEAAVAGTHLHVAPADVAVQQGTQLPILHSSLSHSYDYLLLRYLIIIWSDGSIAELASVKITCPVVLIAYSTCSTSREVGEWMRLCTTM